MERTDGVGEGDEGVSLRVDGPVATVVFDREGKHNAFRLATWLAVPRLIAAAEHDADVGIIVVRGARGNFGVGNDIREMKALSDDPVAAERFGRSMADAMRAVETASKPVVMAVEGLCYGASVALALCGDLRLAAADAVFALTPAKLGAVYLRSDLHRLVAAVGEGQGKRLIYLAEPIGAIEACDIGLVQTVAPPDRFEAALEEMTAKLMRSSPTTLLGSKAMFRSIAHGIAPSETDESLAWFVSAAQGPDWTEGMEAFLAKRAPRFRGVS